MFHCVSRNISNPSWHISWETDQKGKKPDVKWCVKNGNEKGNYSFDATFAWLLLVYKGQFISE